MGDIISRAVQAREAIKEYLLGTETRQVHKVDNQYTLKKASHDNLSNRINRLLQDIIADAVTRRAFEMGKYFVQQISSGNNYQLERSLTEKKDR